MKKDETTNHGGTADENRAIFQLRGGILDGLIPILSPSASHKTRACSHSYGHATEISGG